MIGYPQTLAGWAGWLGLALLLFAAIVAAGRAAGLNAPPRCSACHEPMTPADLNAPAWQTHALCRSCDVRRDLAWRFAHPELVRQAAIDELAERRSRR